jgi:hypothetical protein
MQYPAETEPTSAVLVVGTAVMKEGGASVAHHLPLQAVHWNWLALQSLSPFQSCSSLRLSAFTLPYMDMDLYVNDDDDDGDL